MAANIRISDIEKRIDVDFELEEELSIALYEGKIINLRLGWDKEEEILMALSSKEGEE